mgnify:CR=1 FL=1
MSDKIEESSLSEPEQEIKINVTDNAKKRLLALENMEDLGSGFSIASRDLEIRGAGALLGESQSGEIQEIGFSLYNRILAKAISSLKSGKIPNLDNPLDSVTEIDINEVAIIPCEYINDVNQRLIMYKKIASTEKPEQLDDLVLELINRFGNTPEEVNTLIDVTKMKINEKRNGKTSQQIEIVLKICKEVYKKVTKKKELRIRKGNKTRKKID